MSDVYFLSNTRNKTVVKIIGSGSATISIDDLLLDDQTIEDPANVEVALSRAVFSLSAPATIVRDGVTVAAFAPGNLDLNLASMGAGTNSNQDKDITVTTSGTANTIFLVLKKQRGITDPNFQTFFGKDFINGGLT